MNNEIPSFGMSMQDVTESLRGQCYDLHLTAVASWVYSMIQQRDAALAQNAELVAQVDALREDNKKLKERNRKLDVDLLKALFYAPSSPVSAQKAQEIEVWYGKFKQVVLAKNSGESADQYEARVKDGE